MTSVHRSRNSSRGSCLNLPLRFFSVPCEGQALALRPAPQAPVGLDRLIQTRL